MKKNISLSALEEKETDIEGGYCDPLDIRDLFQFMADESRKKGIQKRLDRLKKNDDGTRKRQIDVFVDKDHEVTPDFYSVFEESLPAEKVATEMRKLIVEDPDFLNSYLALSHALVAMNKDEEAEAILKEAYERALVVISDAKGRWPREMSWRFLENRHIMRAIEFYGLLRWKRGFIEEPLAIFRKLLRTNPRDNQGARYNILAIRMGLAFDEWEKPFEITRDGKISLDAGKLSNWFDENAPKFEDEFKWLLAIYKSYDE
jgi:tetratricopeptide (TPR) repeat protein